MCTWSHALVQHLQAALVGSSCGISLLHAHTWSAGFPASSSIEAAVARHKQHGQSCPVPRGEDVMGRSSWTWGYPSCPPHRP